MALESFPFPEVNASLNALAATLLLVGFVFIKCGRTGAHKFSMGGALFVSALFLISYITYHVLTGARTPFEGRGIIRFVYYSILITHIILAVAIIPLALRTFQLALIGRFITHKKWARVTFPLWLYVSVTGVLIYFFLYVWYT